MVRRKRAALDHEKGLGASNGLPGQEGPGAIANGMSQDSIFRNLAPRQAGSKMQL
jgi:hypothetical protein